MTFLSASQKNIIEKTRNIDTGAFRENGLWHDEGLISTENGNIRRRIDTLTGNGIPILTQKHNDRVFDLLVGAIARRGAHLESALIRLRRKTTKDGRKKV